MVWRRAALNRASAVGDILPYRVRDPENVKAGGSRELPSAIFHPSGFVRDANGATERRVILGSRLLSCGSAKHAIGQNVGSSWGMS
jgi:hypothetical protein